MTVFYAASETAQDSIVKLIKETILPKYKLENIILTEEAKNLTEHIYVLLLNLKHTANIEKFTKMIEVYVDDFYSII